MSTVDQRIVEMRFDNEQFERGVKETLKSLDKLKVGLDIDSSTKSLNNLEKAVNNFTFDKIGESAVRTTESFSILYRVGSEFINRLANSAVDAGIKIAKSLSIDNITTGFSKYEQQSKAVQMILNNTEATVQDTEDLIDKLMWYTDETSYSFDAMISNIGKFTGAGIDLDLASKGMIGLANACGLAGVETSMASHAMEGFSKAMAQGYMDNRNWSWIRTARLDTKVFKQQLIDTAEQMGVLKRDTKGILRDANKTEVTFENFQTTLADKWLTKDVMTQALAEYSDYTEAIYEIAMRENISASEAMEIYSEDIESLGQKSFKAAQEARTFTDAIEATKDAVSSKFSRMFSLLFGNYEEAKTTWTNLSVYLWDVFAYPLQQINDSLRAWKKSGGFEMLFAPPESGDQGAFYNYLDAIYAYTDAFNELNNEFFFGHEEGELSNFAQAFLDLSARVKEASESFKVSDEMLERYLTTVQRVYSVIRSGFDILSAVGTIIGKTIRLLKEGVNEILPDLDGIIGDTVDSLSDFAANLKKAAKEFEYSEETVERVRQVFRGAFTIFSYGVRILRSLWTSAKKVFDYFGPAAQALGRAFDYALPYVEQFLIFIGEQISVFEQWVEESDIVQSVITFFINTFNKAKTVFGKVSQFLTEVFNNMANAIQELTGYDIRTITWETILDLLRRIGEVLQPLIPLILEGVQAIGAFVAVLASDAAVAVSGKIAKLINKFDELKQSLSDSATNKRNLIQTFINDIKSGRFSISTYIKNLQIVKDLQEVIQKSKDKLAKLFENFSIGGAILSAFGGSLIYLNLAFGDMASTIAGFFASITSVGFALGKFFKSLGRAKMLKAAVLGLVTVILALTAAIGYLSYVGRQEGGIEALKTAFDIIWKTIAVMAAFAVVIGIFSSLKTGKTFTTSFFALAAFVAALGVLIFSLIELKDMGDEDILSGVWPVFAVIVLLAGLMFAVAKLGKGASWGGGLWQAVAFAAAVYILVEALANLRHLEFNYESIADLVHQLGPLLMIMVSLALLLTAVGGMKIRGTIAFVLFLKVIRLLIEDLDALSKVANPGAIKTILNAVTVLVGVIAAFSLVNKLLSNEKGIAPKKAFDFMKLFAVFAALILAFIGISYAFSLLANAEKNVGSITGIVLTLSIFIFAMLAVSALIGKYVPTIMNGVGMFIGLAGAVLLLALAFIAISYAPLDMATIGKTLLVITALAGIALAMSWLSSKIKGAGNIGLSILALASSVLILALGLRMLDAIDLSKIGSQLAWLTAAFAVLVLAGSIGRGAKGAPKSILALSASVLILALALAALSFLPDENIDKLWSIAGVLAMLVGVFALVVWAASQMPAKGVLGPLIAIVVGLGIIIAGLFVLADKPWQGLLGAAAALFIALIGLAGAMLMLSAASEKVSGLDILGMGLGMGVLAASLYVVALAIKQLEGINFWQMAGSVVVLVLALAGIAAVMWAIGKYGALYAIFGAAAFIILAGALLILTAAALAVWDAFSGGNDLDTWINGLRNTIDGTSEMLTEADDQTNQMKKTAEDRAEAKEQLEEAMAPPTASGGSKRNTNRRYNTDNGNRITKGLEDYTDSWVNGKILNGRTIEQLEAQFTDPEAGIWATVAAGSGADASKSAGEANGESYVDGAIGAITSGITGGLQEAFQGQDVLGSLLGGEGEGSLGSLFGNGVSLGGLSANASVKDMAEAAGTTLDEAATNAVTSGKSFAEGFANGIDANSALAINYAGALGQAALQALRNAIQEGSPSKLTYLSGGYFEEGFSNAINDYAYRSADAARALGQATYDALGEGLGRMDGIANGTIRTAPTIRPVLDTRALQNGSRSLDTMFASRQAMYANIADQERRNADDMYQLVDVAYAILGAVTSGHDLYLDGNKLVGRINRGLGKR